MKNLKMTFVIVTIFIATYTISVSCTENDNKEVQNSSVTARLSDNEINKLKADFLVIMQSNEYTAFHNYVRVMGVKMNNENFVFSSRQDFVEWINSNLNKTLFTTTDEAINLYDDTRKELSDLRLKYSDFYNSLMSCSTDEILVICAPEMVHPILKIAQSDCQNTCVDAAELSFHFSDQAYTYLLNSSDDFGYIVMGTYAYIMEQTQISQNYTNCFGQCPI